LRIAILGAAGMLGHTLFRHLPLHFPETFALIHGDRKSAAYRGLFETESVVDHVDATDFNSLQAILDRLGPQTVLNCTGITKRHEDPTHPAPSIAVNSLLPHLLADWTTSRGAKVLNFSTDCVFDGARGNYTEECIPNALDLYGRTKALGELRGASALTIRSSFIGRELVHKTELLEWFLAQKGKNIKGFTNALYTGVSTIQLARTVVEILRDLPQLTGLYHLAGEVISKYQLLLLARDAFNLDVQIAPDESFVCRRNLDGSRLQQILGHAPPSWAVMMKEMATDSGFYEQTHRRSMR
jgi:dTDP-4-dehydrorhamnose reductase